LSKKNLIIKQRNDVKYVEFYKVDSIYINKLRKLSKAKIFFDKRRPIIGVVLAFNGFNYFAPLTSATNSWEKANLQTVVKLKIIHENGFIERLGMVRLNNMFPVPKKCLKLIDMDKLSDLKYKALLIKQQQIVIKEEKRIKAKALKLRTKQSTEYVAALCSDFEKLENFCHTY